MFNKIAKKLGVKKDLRTQLTEEITTLHTLHPPTPEKDKKIGEMREQYQADLKAIEKELLEEMQVKLSERVGNLEVMYMRSEIKLRKEKLIIV